MTRNGDRRSHSSGVSNSTPKREAISGTGFAIKLNIFFSWKINWLAHQRGLDVHETVDTKHWR
jgi:hypothetical protein